MNMDTATESSQWWHTHKRTERRLWVIPGLAQVMAGVGSGPGSPFLPSSPGSNEISPGRRKILLVISR